MVKPKNELGWSNIEEHTEHTLLITHDCIGLNLEVELINRKNKEKIQLHNYISFK